MIPASLKRRLLAVHRWLALGLAPLFLLILLSGAVLALKPILHDPDAAALPVRVAPATVAAALAELDPAGQASAVRVTPDGRAIEVDSRDPAGGGTFELVTGAPLAGPGLDPFAFALALHKNLLVGAGVVVEFAAYAMVAILAAGFLLGLPRLRNTLRGWHHGLAWLGLPLVVLTPVTGVLLALHVGRPALPPIAPGAPVPLAQAVAATAAADDGTLVMARRFRAGSALVETASAAGERRYLVQPDGQVAPLTGGPGWVAALHEGTWAGAWSGLLNLIGALGLTGLVGTGVYGWWDRRRARARPRRGMALKVS